MRLESTQHKKYFAPNKNILTLSPNYTAHLLVSATQSLSTLSRGAGECKSFSRERWRLWAARGQTRWGRRGAEDGQSGVWGQGSVERLLWTRTSLSHRTVFGKGSEKESQMIKTEIVKYTVVIRKRWKCHIVTLQLHFMVHLCFLQFTVCWQRQIYEQ